MIARGAHPMDTKIRAGQFLQRLAQDHASLFVRWVLRDSQDESPYCLIQECSRVSRALPHQNAPEAAAGCQAAAAGIGMLTPETFRAAAYPIDQREARRRLRVRFPVRPPSLLSRPDLARRGHGAQRRGWEERSHPQPRAARPCARAWRGWRAPDLPRNEHRGTLRSGRTIRQSPLHWEA